MRPVTFSAGPRRPMRDMMRCHETAIEGEIYALVPRSEAAVEFEGVESIEARGLLARWSRVEPVRFVDLLTGASGMHRVDAVDAGWLLDEALWRLHETHGDLSLGRRKRVRASIDVGPLEHAVPLQDLAEEDTADSEHWIEIRIEDDASTPICNERYELILPDGRVEHGTTDEQGAIYVEGIHKAGACRVVFPELVLDLPVAV